MMLDDDEKTSRRGRKVDEATLPCRTKGYEGRRKMKGWVLMLQYRQGHELHQSRVSRRRSARCVVWVMCRRATGAMRRRRGGVRSERRGKEKGASSFMSVGCRRRGRVVSWWWGWGEGGMCRRVVSWSSVEDPSSRSSNACSAHPSPSPVQAYPPHLLALLLLLLLLLPCYPRPSPPLSPSSFSSTPPPPPPPPPTACPAGSSPGPAGGNSSDHSAETDRSSASAAVAFPAAGRTLLHRKPAAEAGCCSSAGCCTEGSAAGGWGWGCLAVGGEEGGAGRLVEAEAGAWERGLE